MRSISDATGIHSVLFLCVRVVLVFVFAAAAGAPLLDDYWCLGPVDLKVAGPSFNVPRTTGAIAARQIPAEHNEHPRAGYRTAKPSDSPPRASRYAQSDACRTRPPINLLGAEPRAIRRGQAGAGPTRGTRRAGAPAARASPSATRLRRSLKRIPRQEMPLRSVCSLRRSLHGSGRSAASRHPSLPHSACALGATVPYHACALGPPPLTLRMSAAAVESVAERTPARSSFISPYSLKPYA